MKSQKIFIALSNADDTLVERAAESMSKNKKRKNLFFIPVVAVIVTFVLTASAIAFAFAQDPPQDIPEADPPQSIPITEFIESPEPEQGLMGKPNMFFGEDANAEMRADGVYAKVKALRILPDKYRFFSDKNEFYLVEMQTLSALPESQMPERFYFLVPEAYYTDFTAYPTLILHDMWQFTYENSVLYNTVQKQAEMLSYTIFASYWGTTVFLCDNVIAFDENGIFDISLWDSTPKWIDNTSMRDYLYDPSYSDIAVIGSGWTADRCEEAILKGQDKSLYAKSLSSITSNEVLDAIEYVKNPENGLFVPSHFFYNLLYHSDYSIVYRRYINGYPTDEYIRIYGNEVYYSQAKFNEEDAETNIDLASAVSTVSKALETGTITPTHIPAIDSKKLKKHGVFAWYAKTEDGIVGVVKVSWLYEDREIWKWFYDDKYFIIESDSKVCQSIDRDDLLKLVVGSSYIFNGEYEEDGIDMYY